MPSTIRVDTDFRTRRAEAGATVDRALPHRRNYLGFILGCFATVVVALAGFGWAVKSGLLYVQVNV